MPNEPWGSIDNLECGVCGEAAAMWFVHGARCKKHEFQVEPSSAIIGDDVIGVTMKVRRKENLNESA